MENINSSIVETNVDITWYQGFCRKAVLSAFGTIERVGIQIQEAFDATQEQHFFGDKDAEIQAEMTINHPRVYAKLVSNGSIGAAEAYIAGDWHCKDLTALIQAFVIAQDQLDHIEKKASWLQRLSNKLFHFANRNSQSKAKKNILAHYDLGNELYGQFLDQKMMYSSAIYPNATTDLDTAQVHKLDTICQRLELTEGESLVEIGTGWGGLAIHAATHYGVHVTTTTISDAQHEYAEEQIKTLGLEDKITLLKKDYRLLDGTYDKLVSIEMIEAVGHQFYSEFFNKCNALLKPGGKMLIQAITIADQRFEHYKNNVDFIQRYIFPGGCLPSIEVMCQHLRRDTSMVLEELHDIGLDYAKTLEHWRERFNANWSQITTHGFDERFQRLWNFYLCYCEGAFLQRATSTVHFMARK